MSERIPRVRSKDGTPVTFRSVLAPHYACRTKALEAALPWLYFKGVSSGQIAPDLKVLLCSATVEFSENTVSRLQLYWATENYDWREAKVDDEPDVYIWTYGVS